MRGRSLHWQIVVVLHQGRIVSRTTATGDCFFATRASLRHNATLGDALLYQVQLGEVADLHWAQTAAAAARMNTLL